MPGGQVLVTVDEQDRDGEPRLVFQVRDTGEGIPFDRLELIFHPFEQVSVHRNGGVGLGLAIVQNYVEMMGGRITVESEVGRGSVFTVDLPLHTAQPPNLSPAATDDMSVQGVSILLAEDNAITK